MIKIFICIICVALIILTWRTERLKSRLNWFEDITERLANELLLERIKGMEKDEK